MLSPKIARHFFHWSVFALCAVYTNLQMSSTKGVIQPVRTFAKKTKVTASAMVPVSKTLAKLEKPTAPSKTASTTTSRALKTRQVNTVSAETKPVVDKPFEISNKISSKLLPKQAPKAVSAPKKAPIRRKKEDAFDYTAFFAAKNKEFEEIDQFRLAEEKSEASVYEPSGPPAKKRKLNDPIELLEAQSVSISTQAQDKSEFPEQAIAKRTSRRKEAQLPVKVPIDIPESPRTTVEVVKLTTSTSQIVDILPDMEDEMLPEPIASSNDYEHSYFSPENARPEAGSCMFHLCLVNSL